MSNHATKIDCLIRSYESQVAWGGVDQDEALHVAINTAFSGSNDEVKAELFARIREGFDTYAGALVPRKVWVSSIVNQYMSSLRADTINAIEAKKAAAEKAKNEPKGKVKK